ncbi:MAG: hypothetical protein AAF959_25265 [Cyanobacteria bacterium P01_D01_bin.56]
MKNSKQNIEQLAILNAWVTSCVVLLNLLVSFIAFSLPAFNSLSLAIFVSGTVGGAASNYRRLQEAYVQQIKKPVQKLDLLPAAEISQDESYSVAAVTAVETTDTIHAGTSKAKTAEIVEQATSVIGDKSTYFILKLQIFLSPIFGGLFAFVLYAVFVAGIIQGELFPKFKGTEDSFTTPYEFSSNTIPETNADLSKAILWAFIAGFAEGFVPNFIDKLVKDNEQGGDA